MPKTLEMLRADGVQVVILDSSKIYLWYKNDFCPKYFAITVYLLLKKIMEMLPDSVQAVDTEQ